MAATISSNEAQRRLATIWFSFGGGLFALVVAQSLTDRYGEKTEEVWQWFLPTLLPNLSLMLGSFVTGIQSGSKATSKSVPLFFYRIAFALSAFYLVVVLSTMVVIVGTLADPVLALKKSSLWLSPLQALVAIAIGAFFVKVGNS